MRRHNYTLGWSPVRDQRQFEARKSTLEAQDRALDGQMPEVRSARLTGGLNPNRHSEFSSGSIENVMKDLIALRDEVRGAEA